MPSLSTICIRQKSGFTLIELSAVLVIIGLLIGGIMAGQTLVRQSQISSVATDAQMYMRAVLQFRDKYVALPGDMGNATTYWGVIPGSSAADNYTLSCATLQGTGTQTCNGDNNGQINETSATSYYYEMHRAWQHLANAQMIQGSYTGVTATGGTENDALGVNVPASHVPGAGFKFDWVGVRSGDSNWFNYSYKHALFFGSLMAYNMNGYTGNITTGPTLTGAEALAFDTKYDDGLAVSGQIMAWPNGSAYNSNCTTTAVITTAIYNQTTKGLICGLFFNANF